MPDIIIVGVGGHAKVIADIVIKTGGNLLGFLDDNSDARSILGFPVLGKICRIQEYKENAQFVLGIGSNAVREKISLDYSVQWAVLIHPCACIGVDVHIGEGTVIMAGAIVNPAAKIGRHCIINTGSIVEHDNVIGDYVHISPNATLCGTVSIGERTHIGAGAVVKNNLCIPSDCTVGAGCTVVKNIQDSGVYVGTPARRL